MSKNNDPFYPMKADAASKEEKHEWVINCKRPDPRGRGIFGNQRYEEYKYTPLADSHTFHLEVNPRTVYIDYYLEAGELDKYVKMSARFSHGAVSILGAKPIVFERLGWAEQVFVCFQETSLKNNFEAHLKMGMWNDIDDYNPLWCLTIGVEQKTLEDLCSYVEASLFRGEPNLKIKLSRDSSKKLWESPIPWDPVCCFISDDFTAIEGSDHFTKKFKAERFFTGFSTIGFKGKLESLSWSSTEKKYGAIKGKMND